MTTTTIPRGKYHIWTVGCQMNQADSQRIQTLLDEMGWEESGMEQANLVVLNTCSVRQAPEEKAHNQLALLKQAKAQRSDLLVAMMGCMIGNQKTIDALSKRYPHIDLFMKVEQADILPRFLEERWTPISGAGCLDVEFMPDFDEPIPSEPLLPTFATSTSTWANGLCCQWRLHQSQVSVSRTIPRRSNLLRPVRRRGCLSFWVVTRCALIVSCRIVVVVSVVVPLKN